MSRKFHLYFYQNLRCTTYSNNSYPYNTILQCSKTEKPNKCCSWVCVYRWITYLIVKFRAFLRIGFSRSFPLNRNSQSFNGQENIKKNWSFLSFKPGRLIFFGKRECHHYNIKISNIAPTLFQSVRSYIIARWYKWWFNNNTL